MPIWKLEQDVKMDNKTPEHYGTGLTPWDLQRDMKSSGSLFVDARRTDIIEYAFRDKGQLKSDMEKIIHNAQAVLDHLDGNFKKS